MSAAPVQVKTLSQPGGTNGVQSPRRKFHPAQRDPLQLPGGKIELPQPPPHPGPPPTINLLTTILPPALMVAVSLITALISKQVNLTMIIASLGMSIGFPVANLIGLSSQKKKYRQGLEARERSYRQKMADERKKLEVLISRQSSLLEESYPSLQKAEQLVFSESKLMWARRPPDDDFLDLRLGISDGTPSFTIDPPRSYDQTDKLSQLTQDIYKDFQVVKDLPARLSLTKLGSVAVTGNASHVYGMVRRLVLDLIIHHSPQDVQLAVLGDTRDAVDNWEWLKWIAHTDSLSTESRNRRLAFDSLSIDKYLETLMREYHLRRNEPNAGIMPKSKVSNQPAMIVLLDDSGRARLNGDISELAEWGHEARIYLIFVGGRDWPRECRSRLDLIDSHNFKLSETWTRSGNQMIGTYETASKTDCANVACKMAGWDVAGAASKVPLPESIRISNVLGIDALSVESIKQSWSADFKPSDLLQFPIGVCARRDQLDLAMVNLLPGEKGGNDAYHTILIGTTGSGKSEFMKSLVLGAAVRYPPSQLNFFFLDFKGGAAFSVFEDLPHVSGVVTNLKPELTERGLDSIRNEIERRQSDFAKEHVINIWDYNKKCADHLIPHLILFLDEFARGLADFSRLREVLDVLVRQGRSLGMYLILANQDVNSEVDKLMNNVGWRIALKVAKPEEMHMIDRALPSAIRAGQGYLKSLVGDITEFQAGYAGLQVQKEAAGSADEYSIYSVEADGSYRQVFKKVSEAFSKAEDNQPSMREEEAIIKALNQATSELRIKPAARIYLDPLPEVITLDSIFSKAGVQPAYAKGKWKSRNEMQRVSAFWGEQDIPEKCLQEILQTEFSVRESHLWIIGTQGSGKDEALASLIMSLATVFTPEQVQFYMLELGTGELAQFEILPHTGAVIRPQNEKERLIRLLDFLKTEMEARGVRKFSHDDTGDLSLDPLLFVIVNNFAELRATFPDEAERIGTFIREGAQVGIHFIITTSRGPELLRNISGMIPRRLVLQLGGKDEYIDIVGKNVPPLVGIPGRGYWIDEEVSQCQTGKSPVKLRELMRGMREAWKGQLPKPIIVLPEVIPFADFCSAIQGQGKANDVPLLVGRSYESLGWVAPNLLEGSSSWLILGPKESGKSNFLACAAASVLGAGREDIQVRAYLLRRSPQVRWELIGSGLQAFRTSEEIIQDAQALTVLLKENKPIADGKHLLLLIDDLGFAFQPGKEALAKALNELGQYVEHSPDLYVMASGMLDELRMQMASPLVGFLKKGHTGMVLSKDSNEADWLGAQLSLEYRKMNLPLGRGFFVNRGKLEFVQTPLWGECK